MEVLKVKVDNKKPDSGSSHESTKVKHVFKPKIVKG